MNTSLHIYRGAVNLMMIKAVAYLSLQKLAAGNLGDWKHSSRIPLSAAWCSQSFFFLFFFFSFWTRWQ